MGLIRKQYEKTMDKQTNNKDKNSSVKIKSIKSELLITMLSISVVLTLGIILCVSTILSKYYDNEINSKNEMLSKLISKNVSSFMDTAYKVTEDLAYNSEVREGSKDIKEKVLKETKDRNPYFELLYMQDEKGMQTGRSSGILLTDQTDGGLRKQKALYHHLYQNHITQFLLRIQ